MTQEYKELLEFVAENGAINGEKAIEVTLTEDPEADVDATRRVTESFRKIKDKIHNDEELSQADYALLWVGSNVSKTLIQKNIDKWTAVIHEYEVTLMPRLYAIATCRDQDKSQELIEEYFNKN